MNTSHGSGVVKQAAALVDWITYGTVILTTSVQRWYSSPVCDDVGECAHMHSSMQVAGESEPPPLLGERRDNT